MAYLSFEQVAVSNSVLTETSFTIPAKATHVELQASVAGVAYTMDGSTDPTVSAGMVLLVTEPPKAFLVQDLKNMKFIRFGGSDAKLNDRLFMANLSES